MHVCACVWVSKRDETDDMCIDTRGDICTYICVCPMCVCVGMCVSMCSCMGIVHSLAGKASITEKQAQHPKAADTQRKRRGRRWPEGLLVSTGQQAQRRMSDAISSLS